MNRIILSVIKVLVFMVWIGTANAMLISVDFQENQGSSSTFSGVELDAAAASNRFISANIWNALELPNLAPSAPSFNGLVNNSGMATSVGFNITSGTASAFVGFGGDALRTDFMYFNSRENSSSIDWELTNLAAGNEYQFYSYYTLLTANQRNFNLLVDTDGDGDLSDETPQNIKNDTSDAFFSSIIAGSDGRIIGRAEGVGVPINVDDLRFESNWAGFQLATVPEPSTLAVFALGLCGLMRLRKGQ